MQLWDYGKADVTLERSFPAGIYTTTLRVNGEVEDKMKAYDYASIAPYVKSFRKIAKSKGK